VKLVLFRAQQAFFKFLILCFVVYLERAATMQRHTAYLKQWLSLNVQVCIVLPGISSLLMKPHLLVSSRLILFHNLSIKALEKKKSHLQIRTGPPLRPPLRPPPTPHRICSLTLFLTPMGISTNEVSHI